MWDLVDDPQGTLLRTLDYAASGTGAASQPMVTDWIVAVVGVLTLLTAIGAGVGAWLAARWTKRQAIAAGRQVEIAGQNLAVAKQDAEVARALADDQRRGAALAARRIAEDRVDVQMPTVLIRATPGTGSRHFLEERVTGVDAWRGVTDAEELEFKEGDAPRALRVNVTFHFENLSDRIARVVLLDPVHGESGAGGDGVLLRPDEKATVDWSRVISSAELRDDKVLEELAYPRPKLWVRDLGMNAYDVVDIVLHMPPVRRDGSRVYVSRSDGWTESIGTPLPGRVYDRLNAEAAAGD